MKKLLLICLAAVFLLAACSKPAPAAPTKAPTEAEPETAPETTSETTPPEKEVVGDFVIQQEVYYDDEGNELARLSVTFNEQGLPQSILMDSGADIAYELTYDENAVVTDFTMTQTVYGEQTVRYAQVNDRGDIIKNVADMGTQDERVFLTSYDYDQQGQTIKKELTRDGKTYLLELRELDQYGNQTRYQEINYASSEMSYESIFTNTYENGLLVQVECSLNGVHEYTTVYTYNENGLCVRESTDNGWVTDYAYNEGGLLTEMTVSVNGTETNRYTYEYDENNNVHTENQYANGEFSRKICYSYMETPQPLTDAQRNIFTQLSIIA